MSESSTSMYGDVIAGIINCASPSTSSNEIGSRLEGMAEEELFESFTIKSSDAASCCLAGLWLLGGQLDESHSISQSIHTPEGSYWHAIMHRREGDFSNSKYWYHRTGDHPVLSDIGRAISSNLCTSQVTSSAGMTFVESGDFDPFNFVDLCEAVHRGENIDADFVRRVERLEWDALFTFCFRMATGT